MDEVRYVIEQVNRAVDRGEEEINLLDYSDIAIGSVINSVVCGYRMTIEVSSVNYAEFFYFFSFFEMLFRIATKSSVSSKPLLLS